MKKILIILIISLTAMSSVLAQTEVKKDTTYWKGKYETLLSFSQTTFTNWASGGENNVAGNAYLNIFENYAKNNISWNNYLGLAYGTSKLQSFEKLRKTDDKINLTSKFGYKMAKPWEYAALFDFKSQFTKGYKYPNDSVYISNFFAPANFQFSLGANYKPSENFSVFMSPIGARLTVVNDSVLRNRAGGAFGVTGDSPLLWQLGGSVNVMLKKDITKNINWMSKMDIFSDYLKDPLSPVFSWENNFVLKVTKFISFNVMTLMISDPNVPYINEHGKPEGSRLQFRETFGVGISYTFSN
ncbi:MAG: DUF3078 domain-containing protein [Bacteroidales bacterium]|jgi:hypothetical protein